MKHILTLYDLVPKNCRSAVFDIDSGFQSRSQVTAIPFQFLFHKEIMYSK